MHISPNKQSTQFLPTLNFEGPHDPEEYSTREITQNVQSRNYKPQSSALELSEGFNIDIDGDNSRRFAIDDITQMLNPGRLEKIVFRPLFVYKKQHQKRKKIYQERNDNYNLIRRYYFCPPYYYYENPYSNFPEYF